VEAAGRENQPLLIPVAVVEQHGHHLPLATDVYGAHVLCSLVRTRLEERGVACQIAPPYYYGLNTTTGMFPGSLTVSPDTMVTVLTEVLENFARWGFRRQFIVNHHGDAEHNRAIVRVIEGLRGRDFTVTYVLAGLLADIVAPGYEATFGEPFPLVGHEMLQVSDSEETIAARLRLTQSPGIDVHAGERETSLVMRWAPETLPQSVDRTALPAVPDSMREFLRAERQGRWREVSPGGHIGDPARATVENGELYVYEADDIAEALAAWIRPRG
jgi:creatinine amidohydrolase